MGDGDKPSSSEVKASTVDGEADNHYVTIGFISVSYSNWTWFHPLCILSDCASRTATLSLMQILPCHTTFVKSYFSQIIPSISSCIVFLAKNFAMIFYPFFVARDKEGNTEVSFLNQVLIQEVLSV